MGKRKGQRQSRQLKRNLRIKKIKRMKNIYCVILICLVFQSCIERKPADNKQFTKAIEDSVHTKLNHEKINDQEVEKTVNPSAAADSIPIHIFKTGETLWDLCSRYYGNRHYAAILSVYNEIDNVNNIKEGTPIKIPSLSYILGDTKLGLSPIIQSEIEQLLKARTLFMKHEKILYDLRGNVKGRVQLDLPENIKTDIHDAAMLIDAAIASLNMPKSDTTNVPVKMVGQLKSVAANLKNLSIGNHDGSYGYDLDMVHQRLIHAITNGIVWAQNNYE